MGYESKINPKIQISNAFNKHFVSTKAHDFRLNLIPTQKKQQWATKKGGGATFLRWRFFRWYQKKTAENGENHQILLIYSLSKEIPQPGSKVADPGYDVFFLSTGPQTLHF